MGSTREGSSTQYQTGVEVADSENCTRLQSAVLIKFCKTGPWWLRFFDLDLFRRESQHKISVSRRGLTRHSSLTNQFAAWMLLTCPVFTRTGLPRGCWTRHHRVLYYKTLPINCVWKMDKIHPKLVSYFVCLLLASLKCVNDNSGGLIS